MQTSSFQSMPCVSEDVARAQVAAALTQLAGEKITIRVMNIEIKESNDMFIAVATYEIIPVSPEAGKENEERREGETRPQDNPEQEEGDTTEGPVLYGGVGGVHGAPAVPDMDVSGGELPPAQTEPAAFEPTGQSNLIAAPEPVPEPVSSPSVSEGPDEEVLAEKVKEDFREAKAPVYNVDESELLAERVAAATEGLNAEEMVALKAEIEKKLAEGVPPEAILPNTGEKPSASA